MYSWATLVSGLTLTGFGHVMDRVRLERYTLVVCVGAGAACLLPALAPSAAVLALLTTGDAPRVLPAYLGLAGMSAGANFTVIGALWAELYGTAHLGAIRGFVQTPIVLGTAAALVAVGWALDAGLGFAAVALAFAAYAALGAAILTVAQLTLRARTTG